MATWILIMTIMATDYRHGSTIAVALGFKSEAACLAAGNAWIKSTRRGASVMALCARDSEGK